MTPLESLLKSCCRCWLEQSLGALTQSCPLPIDRKFRRYKLLPPARDKLLWFQERRNPFSLPQEKGALMKVYRRLMGIQEHHLPISSASWQLPYTGICGFPATCMHALLFSRFRSFAYLLINSEVVHHLFPLPSPYLHHNLCN